MRRGFIVINQSLSRLQNNGSTRNCQLRQSLKFCFQKEKWWSACFGTWKEFCMLSFSLGGTVNVASAWATQNCNTKRTKRTADARSDSLHDSARWHTAWVTVKTVDSLVLEVLPRPPYSLDLAPSDYHVFGPMKKCWVDRNLPQIWRCNGPFVSGLHGSRLCFHRVVERWDTPCVKVW